MVKEKRSCGRGVSRGGQGGAVGFVVGPTTLHKGSGLALVLLQVIAELVVFLVTALPDDTCPFADSFVVDEVGAIYLMAIRERRPCRGSPALSCTSSARASTTPRPTSSALCRRGVGQAGRERNKPRPLERSSRGSSFCRAGRFRDLGESRSLLAFRHPLRA